MINMNLIISKTNESIIELEKMILGNMIKDPDVMEHGIRLLSPQHFSTTVNMEIFTAISLVAKKNLRADTHFIKSLLPQEIINGIDIDLFLAMLMIDSSYSENAYNMINTLQHHYAANKLKHLLQKTLSTLEKNYDDIEIIIEKLQSEVLKISLHSISIEGGVQLKNILSGDTENKTPPFIDQLQKKQDFFLEHGKIFSISSQETIPTGFIDLDKKIGGLVKSNLIIIAARPSMGKTSLAINLAEHTALCHNAVVCILSLEMSTSQLVERFVSAKSKIDIQKIRHGNISSMEFQTILHATKILESANIILNDTSNLSINSISAIAKRLKTTFDIQLLIIDYIQLISSAKPIYNENRQQTISEISRGLKMIARELNIPIIALSQLSRKVEDRPGHRPQMSDLRESGSLEQDADQILFLMRPEYYDPNDNPGLAELIISKNRHGSIGTVLLSYEKEFGTFSNYMSNEQDPTYIDRPWNIKSTLTS